MILCFDAARPCGRSALHAQEAALSLDTNWLEDFRALARTLNFSRAAEQRNVTQPAFGRRIRSLEAWCGHQLVDRSTHRLSLTRAGEAMLVAADDLSQRLERVRNELDTLRAEAEMLTFAATHALSFVFFPDWVQSVPDWPLLAPMRLLSDNLNACERMMQEGSAQFLLCHYREGTKTLVGDDAYRHVVLAKDRLVPVSARGTDEAPLHALPGRPGSPVPCLTFDTTSGMGRILAAALPQHAGKLHISPVFTSHLAVALKAMAIDGKGVAWIPASLLEDELMSGRLVAAGDAMWDVDVQIVLIRRRERMTEIAERFWSSVIDRHGPQKGT
ncbi:MAG: LysR family transcriptional regulator [Alphaproteobacteria bacterium]|nr:LysR family transcriptional regulator [Alphaproteobacteria bacterium]MBU0796837.1 LysR family transcriptional regulator [Alphaproteobacteria bacterium]MBU0885805.1 LysR family transcriptional regulator [Alphaproteobacteria bacterium]MBU1812118.1 LysR family transcriptional regulator [Alphaproteobacteria bacterium]